MSEPIVLGIDPSCQSEHTGIALIQGEKVIATSVLPLEGDSAMQRILSMPSKLSALLLQMVGSRQIDAVVIEGQDLHGRGGRHARPGDIVNLARACGVILGVVQQKVNVGTPIYMPAPNKWKGSIPKAVFLERILERVGLDRKNFGRTKDQQEHSIEATGLALYGLDKLAGK